MSKLPALLLSCTLLLGACADAGPQDAQVPASERIEEVRALRAAVSQPAGELAQAAQRLQTVVRAIRLEPPQEPATRLGAIASAREEDRSALEDAIDTAAATQLPGDGPDAAAAAAAWEAAVAAAREVAAAAATELRLAEDLATADVTLQELITAWDQPGSRNEQLATLAATAERADALAAELEQLAASPSCLEDVRARRDAASFVADATRELREAVAGHRGNEFDRRRAELEDDPYGLGRPLVAVGEDAAACWDDGSGVAQGTAQLAIALEALQDALNPSDLGSPPPS